MPRETCYLCGAENVRIKYKTASRIDITPEIMRCTAANDRNALGKLLECSACGLQYIGSNHATDQQILSAYTHVVDEQYIKNEAARRKTFKRLVRTIKNYLPQGSSILEVGSYCGFFLDEAGKGGFSVSGIEPSTWASSYSSRFNHQVFTIPLSNAISYTSGSYDSIAMWDVIEHLTDPLCELARINKLLKEDGLLFLSTMDVSSWFPALLKRNWPWYMTMHRFYFNEHTLRLLLEQAGFSLVAVRPYVHFANCGYIITKLLNKNIGDKGALSFLNKLILPIYLGDIKMYIARKNRIS